MVLSRYLNEEIILRIPGRAAPIIITLVDIRDRGKARIGVTAEQDISIDRAEIDEKKLANQARPGDQARRDDRDDPDAPAPPQHGGPR